MIPPFLPGISSHFHLAESSGPPSIATEMQKAAAVAAAVMRAEVGHCGEGPGLWGVGYELGCW